MRGDWPFVGRERELTAITALLRGAEDAGIALAGPAGTGKSELMRHALNRLARGDRSLKVLRTTGYASGERIPFGALHRILPKPSEGPAWNPVQQAAEALRAEAGERTLVIGVDDAHLLDDLSVLLLADLARSGAARVAVTVRDGEPAPQTLTALWKDRVLHRIEVSPLSDADMEAALTGALRGQVERATLARLCTAARGNPMLLRELVESGRHSRALTDDDGVWLWRGPWTASPRLRELIRVRLERLDGDQRHAVELLGFADSLGLGLLSTLTSPQAVENLEQAGLVRIDGDAQVRLGHPLHGDLVRAILPATRARARQAELADAASRHGGRQVGDALRVALWRLESGTPATPGSLLEAARQAWAGYDIALTRRLAVAAVAAGSDEAVTLLGDLLLFTGSPEAAEEFLAAPPAWSSTRTRVRLEFLRGVNLVWNLDDVAAGMRRMAEAAPAMLATSWRDDLGPTHVAYLAYVGPCPAALRAARDLAAMPVLSEPGETVRLAAHCLITAVTGHTGEACTSARAAMARMDAHAAVYPWLRGIPALGAIYALQCGGAFTEAEETAANWHDAMVGNPVAWSYATAASALALGRSARLTGRTATAAQHLRDARRLFAEGDVHFLSHLAAAELAHCLALTGDVEGARRLLAEARAGVREALKLLNFSLDAAAAAIAAAERDIDQALAISAAAGARARAMGAPAWELAFLHDMVRLGEPRRALPRLTELTDVVDGPLPGLYLRHAAALADRDGVALDAVAAAFAALGARLHAAEAACQASRAHWRRGSKDPARRSAWQAAQWTESCEGARTPALDVGHTDVLTRRERQIAQRASRGESNAQIAQELGIAPRTVGNHLYNSYDKLGINSRAELAELFRDAPPPP